MSSIHPFLSRRRVTAVGAIAAAVCGGLVLGVGTSPTQAQPSHSPRTWGPIQAPALPGAPPIARADRVYTADPTSNTVTVIDPSTRKVLGTVALGDQRLGGDLGPQYLRDVDVHGLGFSRDGRYLDVVSATTNTVTVLRTVDNTVVSQTSVGRASHEGFFSPDGKTVWVADRALASWTSSTRSTVVSWDTSRPTTGRQRCCSAPTGDTPMSTTCVPAPST